MTTYTGVVKTYYDKEETKLKEEYFYSQSEWLMGKKKVLKTLLHWLRQY